MKNFLAGFVFFVIGLTFYSATLSGNAQAASEYTCEVMSIQGQAFASNPSEARHALAEGSLLKVGDLIEVDENSHVDVAYDKRWNNITRITGKTKIKINSVFPIGLSMDHGDVFAKLAKLPKNSTFEIETPTAVAAVRGSEFRTVCENGVTEVFNLHNSEVEVFGKDLEGNMEKESTVLEQNEKTEVKELGEEPAAPEKMSEEEIREQQAESTELSQEVKEVLDEGRLGEIQDLDTVEKEYEVNLEQRLEDIKDENPELDKDAAGQDGSDNESEKDMNSGMDNIEGATEDMEKALDTIDSTLEGVEDKNDEATDKETEEDLLGNSSEDEGGQGGNFLSTTTV